MQSIPRHTSIAARPLAKITARRIAPKSLDCIHLKLINPDRSLKSRISYSSMGSTPNRDSRFVMATEASSALCAPRKYFGKYIVPRYICNDRSAEAVQPMLHVRVYRIFDGIMALRRFGRTTTAYLRKAYASKFDPRARIGMRRVGRPRNMPKPEFIEDPAV